MDKYTRRIERGEVDAEEKFGRSEVQIEKSGVITP